MPDARRELHKSRPARHTLLSTRLAIAWDRGLCKGVVAFSGPPPCSANDQEDGAATGPTARALRRLGKLKGHESSGLSRGVGQGAGLAAGEPLRIAGPETASHRAHAFRSASNFESGDGDQ